MRLFVWSAAFCSLVAAGHAGEALTPPTGTTLLFSAEADGVQIYSCLPKDVSGKDPSYAWTISAPQATLFDVHGQQIGAHGAGPTWTLGDGSAIKGEVVAKQSAPQKGAIPWLLLRVTSHQGGGRFANAVAVRRIDTKGGAEPAESCDAAHIGQVARVRYSATYQFYGT
ncbi:DUF3455 domain-containing protein [Methylocapsa palsarum]|uniref:DUF3455 domain-containing protein n=1 Tax=Methylocapsa palsarum TaxID=1612308 RepID=A0A1I3VZN4_9HYPH|nr:DUF3455 domain-containing protein [Methylocapsa palsarum]SFK00413.1 Protein of unknown function [Methylocapsa palsarum]